MNQELIAIRLTFVDPPAGVRFSLLDPSNRPVDAKTADGRDLSFDLDIETIGPAADRRFTGTFVRRQGDRRFIYFASGTWAGDETSCWSRRGKVMLDSLDAGLVAEAAASGARLEARVPAMARDGGPACATVKLVAPWRRL